MGHRDSRNHAHLHGHLIFDKMPKQLNGERSLLRNDTETAGDLYRKECIPTPLTPYIKINSRGIVDLNITAKIVLPLEKKQKRMSW